MVHNLGDLVAAVRARVEPIVHRAGYTVEFGGQFEAQQSASRTLLDRRRGHRLVMLLLLHLSTGSLKVAALVMVNLPLATIGGVVAIFITDSHRCTPASGNTLALFGIGSSAFRRARPLHRQPRRLHHPLRHRRAQRHPAREPLPPPHRDRRKPLSEAIVRGSMERLVPSS
jgi:Cu/Ag efflux pump CusA